MQLGMKNLDIRRIYWFISEMIDETNVAMEWYHFYAPR